MAVLAAIAVSTWPLDFMPYVAIYMRIGVQVYAKIGVSPNSNL